MDTPKGNRISAAEITAGEAATTMIVEKLIQAIKRNLGEEAKAIGVSWEEMVAYGIFIFQAAINKVSNEETMKLSEKQVREISFKIVAHQFLKRK